jgi:hypothetical protein
MQFQTPQFIDVEDKIFGPLTFKQFVYVAGGGGLSFVLYKMFSLPIAIILIAPLMGFSIALAFYKINDRPLIVVLEAAFKHSMQSRLYIWRKRDKPIEKKKEEGEVSPEVFVPRISESKLKDIAWSLDVQDSIYAGQHGESRK